MSDKALIIVDVQNDFCPGGSLAVSDGDQVAAAISEYIATHIGQYRVIIASKCWHPDNAEFAHFSDDPDFVDTWPPHCIAGTPGAEFHANLNTEPIRHVFKKGQRSAAYSGFEGENDFGESLHSYLHDRGILEVDVVGIATDYCVRATALDAARNGYITTVLLDLTAAVQPKNMDGVVSELIDANVAVANALV